VISANQYLTADDGGVLINGGSTIISPLGEILAGPLRTGEGILVAELDLAELDRGYFDFDSVGHYARPDIFTLSVDESPHQTVVRRN
jgi:nitrilase